MSDQLGGGVVGAEQGGDVHQQPDRYGDGRGGGLAGDPFDQGVGHDLAEGAFVAAVTGQLRLVGQDGVAVLGLLGGQDRGQGGGPDPDRRADGDEPLPPCTARQRTGRRRGLSSNARRRAAARAWEVIGRSSRSSATISSNSAVCSGPMLTASATTARTASRLVRPASSTPTTRGRSRTSCSASTMYRSAAASEIRRAAATWIATSVCDAGRRP